MVNCKIMHLFLFNVAEDDYVEELQEWWLNSWWNQKRKSSKYPYTVYTHVRTNALAHTHTYKQGQGFLSCHYLCLTDVSIGSSYEYEQKIDEINSISRYALSHWYFNTFSTFVKRVCLILKYSYITDCFTVVWSFQWCL
jgi:hypothetical protein